MAKQGKASQVILALLLLVLCGTIVPILVVHFRGAREACKTASQPPTSGVVCQVQQSLTAWGLLPLPPSDDDQQRQEQQWLEQLRQGREHGKVAIQQHQDKQGQQQGVQQQQQQQQQQQGQQEAQQRQQQQRQQDLQRRQQQEGEQQEKWQKNEQLKQQQEQEQQRKQQQQRVQTEDLHLDMETEPPAPEEVERILSYPFVEDCNLCKVCIPTHLVAHSPKAQARLRARGLEVVQTVDPDVKIEVKTKEWLQEEAKLAKEETRQHPVQQQQQQQRQQQHLQPARLAQQKHQQVNSSWGLSSRRRLHSSLHRASIDGIYSVKGHTIDISAIAPGNNVGSERTRLQSCSVCWGCTHTLHTMAKGTSMLGSYYAHEPGGSPSWLFRVATNRTKSGFAVVKVWCVPVIKPLQSSLGKCLPSLVYSQVKLLLAQHKLTNECGLSDIVPKLWVEPVNGVVPGHGFRINWLGLWTDIADGVSLENIMESGKPRMDPDLMLDLFQNKLNHTEVKLAALFDLFTSQCDRHQQNYFMNEHGKLWAIDNDQVYTTAWRHCGFDSLVLPTTQKFMINHLGWAYVMKFPFVNPTKTWQRDEHPLSLFDYRCHTGNSAGTIGFDFPPALRQCMTRLSKMDISQIHEEYGFPDIQLTEAFRNRSVDFLTKGFEWTLLHGQPTNSPAHRYKLAPKCCSIARNPHSRAYKCLKPEGPKMHQLPYGNPSTGGPWRGPGPDTGAYEGGTQF